MLTRREITIFREALSWYKRYNDSNPDVGMGPSRRMLLMDIEKNTDISLTNPERDLILR